MTGHATETTGQREERPPLVTVVIPTRGRPELLRETLATIIGQDYAGPMEILVVHDREDADPHAGRSLRPRTGGRRDGQHPHRRTVRLTQHRRPGVAWRLRGELRRRRPLVPGQGPPARSSGCSPTPTCWPSAPGSACSWGSAATSTGRRDEAVVTHERLLENRVKELHSSTLMMRRSAFDVAGMYDEELPHGYGEDYDWLLRASRVGSVGAVQEILADIRKDIPSWFRDRWLNTATALEYLLDKHPDFRERRRGHARILGQIAYARAAAGERGRGARIAGRALFRYPAAPHAWLALAVAGPGIEPRRMLSAARRLGRGLS